MEKRKTLLLIDSCIRTPSVSRTYQFYQMFLHALPEPSYHLQTLVLRKENLHPYLESDLEKRDRLTSHGQFEDPIFHYARQFAAADRIVIAAPYWENTFPSLLRVYLEQVSAAGVCFAYENNHPIGLCHAKKLLYLTTVGGFLPHGKLLAVDFIQGLSNLFGIPEVLSLAAEGLDIQGNDPQKILTDCLPRLQELAQYF